MMKRILTLAATAALIASPAHAGQTLVVDNGPELRGRALEEWAWHRGVKLFFIDPGKPVQNAYIESFNGRFREECLNLHWFTNLAEARRIIEAWRVDYNERRPHSSLNYRTPAEFAAYLEREIVRWDKVVRSANIRAD